MNGRELDPSDYTVAHVPRASAPNLHGYLIFGAEPVDGMDGAYHNHAGIDVDDFIYRETFQAFPNETAYVTDPDPNSPVLTFQWPLDFKNWDEPINFIDTRPWDLYRKKFINPCV